MAIVRVYRINGITQQKQCEHWVCCKREQISETIADLAPMVCGGNYWIEVELYERV